MVQARPFPEKAIHDLCDPLCDEEKWGSFRYIQEVPFYKSLKPGVIDVCEFLWLENLYVLILEDLELIIDGFRYNVSYPNTLP